MPIERLDPDRVGILGGDEEDVKRFVDHDFLIRCGMCPNGCGLLAFDGQFQSCGKCNFSTNCRPELEAQ
jgi:hypothetical protein